MGLLATLLEGVFGRFMPTLLLPVLAVAALTFGHMAWERRDERLRMDGERRCDARWEEEVREEERSKAAQSLLAGRALLAAERATTEGLNDELAQIKSELDRFRADAASGPSAGDCLSRGVLDALGRREGGDGRKQPRQQ